MFYCVVIIYWYQTVPIMSHQNSMVHSYLCYKWSDILISFKLLQSVCQLEFIPWAYLQFKLSYFFFCYYSHQWNLSMQKWDTFTGYYHIISFLIKSFSLLVFAYCRTLYSVCPLVNAAFSIDTVTGSIYLCYFLVTVFFLIL